MVRHVAAENPVQQALRLPEIVGAVIPYLAVDRASVYAALRVNRLWAAVALPLLWRRVPCAAIEGAAARRSHVFDGAIHALDVTVARPRFHRVRRFGRRLGRRIHHHGRPRGELVSTGPWALPHVHELTVRYGATSLIDAAPLIAAWIKRFASRLTAVTIAFDKHASVRGRRARVAAALGCSPGFVMRRTGRGSLSFVEGDDENDDDNDDNDDDHLNNSNGNGTDGDADDDSTTNAGCVLRILGQLARCPDLRQLSLAPLFSGDAVGYVLSNTRAGRRAQALFLRLRSADMHVHGLVFRYLCQQLDAARLTRLRLTIVDGHLTEGMFESVAEFEQLRSLTLAGIIDTSVSGLLRLRCLTELRELDLQGVGVVSRDYPRPDDDDVGALVRPLPRLRTLKLSIVSGLTWRAVDLVGRHCPQLARLALRVDLALDAPAFVGTPKPLFPQLEALEVFKAHCFAIPNRCVLKYSTCTLQIRGSFSLTPLATTFCTLLSKAHEFDCARTFMTSSTIC
jgi:hypothetical protein